jgi:hypothetical protein
MNEILQNGAAFILVPQQEWKRMVDVISRIETIMQEREEPDGWISTEEACSLLKVTPRTLGRWRETYKLKISQVGRNILYSVKDINRLLKRKEK